MKRAIVLSILGLGVATPFVYGQASISFNTYNANHGAGVKVTYGMGPLIGQGIDNTFTGVLLYSLTPINDAATTSGTLNAPLDPGLTVGSVGTFASAGVPNGYIVGPDLNIPTASDGQTVYLEVAAYNGTSWGTSLWEGHSASFTATVVGGIGQPNPDQLDNLQPFQVFGPVPEPTTVALGGLGLATLSLLRRK